MSALVLCEGKEDRIVLEKVSVHAGLQNLRFEDYGGKDNLGNFLRGLLARPDFARRDYRTLALTRDADESYERAWQSLTHVTQQNVGVALQTPGDFVEKLDPEYPEDVPVRVVGWVLPGPGQTGMLESLCLQSVSDQAGFACLNRYFECLGAALGQETFHPKAKFHAWVVGQTDFADKDYKIEKAVKEDRFVWAHDAFEPLRVFLRSLTRG